MVSRGFFGRKRPEPSRPVPPGQYLENGFPVLSAGPTPRTVPVDGFLTDEFANLVETLPSLKIVIEHLGGLGSNAVHDAKPSLAQYQEVLNLAHFPNTYIKIHGMGEFCDPPFPYQDIPPYLKMAYDTFGAQRMTWGSDYPPVLMREGYRNALHFTMEQLPFCSKEELEWVFGKTALSLWDFS